MSSWPSETDRMTSEFWDEYIGSEWPLPGSTAYEVRQLQRAVARLLADVQGTRLGRVALGVDRWLARGVDRWLASRGRRWEQR